MLRTPALYCDNCGIRYTPADEGEYRAHFNNVDISINGAKRKGWSVQSKSMHDRGLVDLCQACLLTPISRR